MAKCAFCGKETSFGKQLSITRSHISKRSTRTVKPNLGNASIRPARLGCFISL